MVFLGLVENGESIWFPYISRELGGLGYDVRTLNFSDPNDLWGCDDVRGKEIFENLGGVLILNHEGHMGSDVFEQLYKEFPFLLKLVNLKV